MSHSHCCHLNDDPISRKLAGSVLEIGYTRDSDGFIVPSTLALTGSRLWAAEIYTGSVAPSDFTGSGRSSGSSLVENSFFQSRSVAENGVYMHHVDEEFSNDIASLVHDIGKERSFPAQPPAQVWHDIDLYRVETGGG